MIDGISSWWATAHGHNHPFIAKHIKKQLKKFPHVMFAGLAHKPAYKLANELVKFVNKDNLILDKAFFSDSGSTGVEVALKMAVQHHYNLGTKKTQFIAFKNSYHGDTFGAMSLADPDSSMHAKFQNVVTKQVSLAIPDDEAKFQTFINTLDSNKNIAGLIIEPLIQCAGGMKCYDIETLNKIVFECKKRDIIVIFDECATGFYRTGAKFAFHLTDFTPDIIVLGKALTGGTITLSATIAKSAIFNSFLSDSLDNALMHGPTFMANPVACSAALASLELFNKTNYEEKVKNINKLLEDGLHNIHHENISDIRILGAIGIIEFKNIDWEYIQKLRRIINKSKIWIRPFSNVIYLMPPLTIKNKDLLMLINETKKLIESN